MNSSANRPTLQTIADVARVSRMTVSRALRNDPVIPTKTRNRIQKIARRVGYQPDPLVSTLMSHLRRGRARKLTSTIAHISMTATKGSWRAWHPYRQIIEGASQRAAELGYTLEEFWLKEPGMTARRMNEILKARNIHGLLVGPIPRLIGHLSIDWSRFASTVLGYSVWQPSLHRVAPDYTHALLLAMRQLRHLGYRRIGLAMWGVLNKRVNYQWTAAYHVVEQHARASERVPPLCPLKWDEVGFARWFRKHRPDVVLGSDRRVLEWLRNVGRCVPDDTGFVHLDLRSDSPPCAGVDLHGGAMGTTALDLIVSQLQRNELGFPAHPKTVLIKGEWMDGPTVQRQ